jgi:carbon storage regulator
MLVLSRKLGERIVIGDGIVVTVVKIDRNQIRLGIEAPSDVQIYRQELLNRENFHAMQHNGGAATPRHASPQSESDGR